MEATATDRHERLLVALSRWRINVAAVLAWPALLAAAPTVRSILVFLPVTLAGVALRTWARGNLDRAERVCRGGPYGWVRHPLYVGSFLMGLGVTLMMRRWWLVPLYVGLFLLMYVPKAIREQRYLRQRFGGDYDRYVAEVGAFLPRRLPPRSADARDGFVWRRVWRHREWRTWLGVAAVLGVLYLRAAVWPGSVLGLFG